MRSWYLNKIKAIVISLLMVSAVNANTLDDIEDFVMDHKVLTLVSAVVLIQVAEPIIMSGLIGAVASPLASVFAPEALGEVGLATFTGFSESALAESSIVTVETLGQDVIGSEMAIELENAETILEL